MINNFLRILVAIIEWFFSDTQVAARSEKTKMKVGQNAAKEIETGLNDDLSARIDRLRTNYSLRKRDK